MKINYMSDLHLEFEALKDLPGGDVLLLAGDVFVATYFQEHRTDKDARRMKARFYDFIEKECVKYDKVYYIMGNHEHYRYDFNGTYNLLKTSLEGSNVTLLEKEHVELDGKILWAATLWTDFDKNNPLSMLKCESGMNDFKVIREKFKPIDAAKDHSAAIASLEETLIKYPDKEFIVMTHHAPSYLSCLSGYRDELDGAYASNLHGLFEIYPQIKTWVHGHLHNNVKYDLGVHGARVVSNCRGYGDLIGKTESCYKTFDIDAKL